MFNPFQLLSGRRSRKSAPVEFAGFQRDPFDAVPVRNDLAEAREDSQGCYQLRLRLPPKPGMASFLANKLGFHRDVRVDLDRHGSFYWAQIDGQRDLHAIEEKVRREFSLDRQDSRRATLVFTKMLMLRHLVQLDLRDQPAPVDPQPTTEAVHHA